MLKNFGGKRIEQEEELFPKFFVLRIWKTAKAEGHLNRQNKQISPNPAFCGRTKHHMLQK